MDIKFIILFSVVFVLFLLNRFYIYAEAKRKKALKDKVIPTDREILASFDDPLTGEKIRLSDKLGDSDDMLDGIDYEGSNRTSEKILNKYSTQDGDLEKELHLIKNYLLDQSFVFRRFNNAETNYLEKTKILSGFEDWSYSHSYHKDNLSIFIATIVAVNNRGKGGGTIENTSICFWLRDFKFSGHYCFYKKTIAENVIGFFKSDEIELKKDYQTVIIRKSGMENELSQFLETLRFDGDLEIEVNDANVFIRITNVASFDNMARFYNLVKDGLN
ncbi:MAG: hypothetical protein QM710_15265 [Flavobacterium sp.]